MNDERPEFLFYLPDRMKPDGTPVTVDWMFVEYAKRLPAMTGLDSIDSVLSSQERFPRLEKVTFVVTPESPSRKEDTRGWYASVFDEFQLKRCGRMELVFCSDATSTCQSSP